MQIIEVPKGVKKRLIFEFYTNNNTVDNALKLITRTEKADAIRKRAFELGGKIKNVEQVKPND